MSKYEPGHNAVAAVLYDLHHRGSLGYTGLTLVVDLDLATAALCQCAADGTATQLWETKRTCAFAFFAELGNLIFPNNPNRTTMSHALYNAAPTWNRALRSYLRNPQPGITLPAVLEGTSAIDVDRMMALFKEKYEQPIRQALEAASAYLSEHNMTELPRILPVGMLAKFYPAEHLIRTHFFPGHSAMLPVLPGLAACTPEEDPSTFYEKGQLILAQQEAKTHVLETTIMLQVQRRSPEGLVSELLTLAEQGTPFQQLREPQYSAPVFVDIREPLVIFAGSKMHRVTIPAGALGKDRPAARTRIGLTIYHGAPALLMQTPSGIIPLPLDLS